LSDRSSDASRTEPSPATPAHTLTRRSNRSRQREAGEQAKFSDDELREHLSQIAGSTVSSLQGAYLELERRARAEMLEAQEQIAASQALFEASQSRAEALTAQNAAATETLVKLTWAIVVLTIVNVVAVLASVL
jgi:hypothetical protein